MQLKTENLDHFVELFWLRTIGMLMAPFIDSIIEQNNEVFQILSAFVIKN